MTHAPITILHVDDDPDLAETAALFIERENEQMEITTATSVSDGFALLADTEFDCIVSDYEMPGRNGIEFLKQVREDYPELPFILYTGKGSEEVASEAVSAGVTEYMQKEGGTDQYTVLANRIENSVTHYRAQQEADQMRQRLRELTESTTDCRWMFDSDWEELLFISGYEDVWQRSVEGIQANPQDFLNGIHPEDRERVEQAMERLSTGEQLDIEYRILRDDDVGWVWVKGEPIYEDERVARVVGLTREITERKKREQELERVDERISFALEQSNAGIWEMDTETETIESYPPRCPIFEEEIQTATEYFEKVHPDDVEQVQQASRSAIETGDSATIEFRPIPEVVADWVECLIKPITEGDGTVTQLTGFTRDISDRKRREQQLRRQNERLNAFTSAVSHDLRSPLTVAAGHLEMLQDEYRSEHIDAAVDAIDRCAS